jgi:hypothetical protein
MGYRIRFSVPLEVTVTVDADDTEAAIDQAVELADDYLQTVWGDSRGVYASYVGRDALQDAEVLDDDE